MALCRPNPFLNAKVEIVLSTGLSANVSFARQLLAHLCERFQDEVSLGEVLCQEAGIGTAE